MHPPPSQPRPPRPPRHGLLRNLGAFFGHIASGVKSSPAPTPPPPAAPPAPLPAARSQVVRHEVAERTVQTPRGEFVLRRTVIDEVQPVAPPHTPAPCAAPPPPPPPPNAPARGAPER